MFAQQILNGLLLGGMYALLAISFALVLGILGKLNLAQGEVLMAGAFVTCAVREAGFGMPLALLCAVMAGGALSLLIELVCFRLPKSGDEQTPIVTTIAMSLILQNLYTEIWGSEPLRFPSLGWKFTLQLGPLTLNAVQVMLLASAVLLMVALSLLISKTWLGREIRTVAQNPIAAKVVGISQERTVVKTFLLSGMIAGGAGVVAGLVLSSITPFVGTRISTKAMIAMVIGGAGSMTGAMVAGLLLGVVEILSVTYLGVAYREIVSFVLLILFLWFRPQGIFRQGKVERI